MIVKLCLSFMVPLLIGFILLHAYLPLNKMNFAAFLLKISLAVGLGFGITSCTYFLSLLTMGPYIYGVVIYEAGVFIFVTFLFVFYMRTQKLSGNGMVYEKELNFFQPGRFITMGFYSVLGLSFVNILYIAILMPNGTWDALAIWNMHARFLFRGGGALEGRFFRSFGAKTSPRLSFTSTFDGVTGLDVCRQRSGSNPNACIFAFYTFNSWHNLFFSCYFKE